MADSLKRRDFIRSVSLAGASIAISPPFSAEAFVRGGDEIRNKHFRVTFDRQKGVYHIYRSNGSPLLIAATACVNLPAAAGSPGMRKRSISDGQFKHSVKSAAFRDDLGTGKRMTIHSRDLQKKTDLEIHISLYDQVSIITVGCICKNVSNDDLTIHSLEPVRVLDQEGGSLHVPGVSKCITNGEMYFDDGTIHEFGTGENAISSGHLKGVTLANGPFPTRNETVHSWWNAGLFSGYEREGIAIGYLENHTCLGNLLISKTAPDKISFLAESVFPPALRLVPGSTIHSNRLMITSAESPYKVLENYADAVGRANQARTRSIINGWCSWFYTLAQVSEEEVLSNTAFAAQHLRPFGLKWIQIDEGYQRWHGDWEGNERFPHGMKWLADQIKGYGFKAGIWISPYVVSEPAEVFQRHPEWFLKNADGTPQRVGNWPEGAAPPEDENPKRYCLDITHPGAAQWLRDLIHTIAHDWGYEMIKVDFVAWSILAAKRYHDPTLSSAQVYRKGMEIMREAAGDKCHILECGPGAITVGLVDSMRIELDVNYGFADTAWSTYFTDAACSASAAGKRYYFHKRTWVNDADHVCMHLLNNEQAEAAASLIAMSGGNMISGDRLTQLSPYKLEILRKITPSYGKAATPVDLFDTDIQSVFALRIRKPYNQWTVAAFFNPGLTEAVEKKYSLGRFWLDPGKTYIAFDFWKQELIGEVSNEIKVTIQPGSVRLLSLHEKKGHPQVISTDRHVLQGALEIENVEWDENTHTISGISTGPRDSSHNVYVYSPQPHPWTWGGYVLFRDFELYTLKLVRPNVIQVHVKFVDTERVNWQIRYDDFFK